MKTLVSLIALSAALVSTQARADMVAALSGDNSITMIDTAQKKVTGSWKISGASGRILGVDMRPADGKLYALAADGSVFTVDTKDGKATLVVKLEQTLPAGIKATVDFNPVADRLRIIGSDGTSLRANLADGKVVVDGKLKYAADDAAKDKTPMVTAGAYSNSFAGTKETVLYDIDAANGAFLKQVPPNDGILVTLGKLPVKGDFGFDIASDGKGGNWGWLVSGGELHKVDISNGATTSMGKIAGLPADVRDIAVVGVN